MKEIEINIQLDPVEDGAIMFPKQVVREDKGALIIGTNGEYRFAKEAEREGLMDIPIKVALMGCVVNGPGEAREADIGIAGGDGEAVLISRGKIIEKIPEDKIIERLISAEFNFFFIFCII